MGVGHNPVIEVGHPLHLGQGHNGALDVDKKVHDGPGKNKFAGDVGVNHTQLAFHKVREAVASKYVDFTHIAGNENTADILSKHWSYGDVKDQLQALMFWEGDTLNIEKKPPKQ